MASFRNVLFSIILLSFSAVSLFASIEKENAQSISTTKLFHNDFDLEKMKAEWKGIVQSYSNKKGKIEQKELVYSLESTLLQQVNTYPKHEKEILDAAKSMFKSAGLNWIIFRNKTQLKIRVVPEQEAKSKG